MRGRYHLLVGGVPFKFMAACLTLAGLSVSAADAADSAAEKPWLVTGRVVDEQGHAVAGVRVWLSVRLEEQETKPSTESDADGRFQLEWAGAVSGRVVRAEHERGAKLSYAQLPYDIEEPADLLPVELVLRPARGIELWVADGDGRPVADATVLSAANYEKLAEGRTDAQGRARIHVPADAPLQHVLAYKPDVGFDYMLYRLPDEPKSDPYRLAPDHAEPIALVLNGTRTVTVRVVGDEDRPLTGVKVYPWLLEKPNKGDDLNLSGLELFQTTDDDGSTTFHFVPQDNTRRIVFWAHVDGYYAPERTMFDPVAPEAVLVSKQFPLVLVSGRVVFEDGRPAADIEVQVAGAGYSMDHFRGSTKTDAAGRFKLKVHPDQYYQSAAGNRLWASPPVNKIVYQGQPVEGTELTLQPATRVFGRVTIGPEESPLPDTNVALYQRNAVSYYDLPEAARLPNPTESSLAIQPLMGWSTTTDEFGNYEFFVGPGKYYLIGPRNVDSPNFDIAGEVSREVNLHAEHPDEVPISGRVVLRDDPAKGVANARVSGYAKRPLLRDLRATSDAEGRFEAVRGPSEMVVYAATSDRQLAGIVHIGSDDEHVEIPIGPTASAHGRLVDQESGEPLADRQIDYGIFIEFEDGTFDWRFGGSSTTDERGEFTIDGLVVGQEYVLEAVTETDGQGQPRSWHNVGKVTAASAARVEIGDLRLPLPYREPTMAERVAKAFADPASLDERLARKLRDARLGYQRVLLIFGDAKSPLVEQLYELEYDAEMDGAFYDYLLLPVDGTGSGQAEAARRLATEHSLTWPQPDDATLAILDESGALVAQKTCSGLTIDGAIDQQGLIAFLRDNRRELPDAEELLADAIARAKAEDKRVLVQVSGPRCGWCVVLSRFLDDHQELIDKEFTYVKLDPRLGHGKEVIELVRPDGPGGIPWMVILDADGEPLITSDGPNGNIGYPGEPEGHIHFEVMLRTSAKHLTDADIESLMAALAGAND